MCMDGASYIAMSGIFLSAPLGCGPGFKNRSVFGFCVLFFCITLPWLQVDMSWNRKGVRLSASHDVHPGAAQQVVGGVEKERKKEGKQRGGRERNRDTQRLRKEFTVPYKKEEP